MQGRVIQDLDNDGNEGTGWTILYMHIEGRDRVRGRHLREKLEIGLDIHRVRGDIPRGRIFIWRGGIMVSGSQPIKHNQASEYHLIWTVGFPVVMA